MRVSITQGTKCRDSFLTPVKHQQVHVLHGFGSKSAAYTKVSDLLMIGHAVVVLYLIHVVYGLRLRVATKPSLKEDSLTCLQPRNPKPQTFSPQIPNPDNHTP